MTRARSFSIATALAALMVAGCARENAETETPPPTDPAPAAAETTDTEDAPDVAPPDIPNTEIFVAPLTFEYGAPVIGALVNASSHPGYDNQPSFIPGEAVFLFSSAGDNGKTDIWLYDIFRSARLEMFTSPEVSEYSPRVTPDGDHISYIQENETGDITRVHQRARDGSDDGDAVVDFAPLGYYAWLDGEQALGVYYRSEPGSLYRVDIANGETEALHANIGRALAADKAGANLWFTEAPAVPDEVESEDDAATEAPAGPFRVMHYDVASGAITPLFDLPGEAQDFALFFDEADAATAILSADGTTLYYRELADGSEWMSVADLGAQGLSSATRIAVSDDKNWIAIVGEIEG